MLSIAVNLRVVQLPDVLHGFVSLAFLLAITHRLAQGADQCQYAGMLHFP
jgi:hypothetical protein